MLIGCVEMPDAGQPEDTDADFEDEEGEEGEEDEEGEGADLCGAVEALPYSGVILAIGDSLFDAVDGCGDAPHLVGLALGERVRSEAAGGASLMEDIPGQYVSEGWEWVIVNGGANDLDCDSTAACSEVVDELEGVWHELIETIRDDGVRVVMVGYPQTKPGVEGGEIWDYGGEALMSMMDAVASRYDGVFFADTRPVMDGSTNPELFAADQLHPSAAGAVVMAEVIVQVMEDSGG